MRVIKQGKVPKPWWQTRRTCPNCGTVAEPELGDERRSYNNGGVTLHQAETSRDETYAKYRCPLCGQDLIVYKPTPATGDQF